MREIRKSGSEGGVGFNPPFLPLSLLKFVPFRHDPILGPGTLRFGFFNHPLG